MIEKTSGRVSYAVLGFGGFLGIGSDHYPLPWDSLKYDTTSAGIGWASPRTISKMLRSMQTSAVGIGTSLAGLNGRRLLRPRVTHSATRIGTKSGRAFGLGTSSERARPSVLGSRRAGAFPSSNQDARVRSSLLNLTSIVVKLVPGRLIAVPCVVALGQTRSPSLSVTIQLKSSDRVREDIVVDVDLESARKAMLSSGNALYGVGNWHVRDPRLQRLGATTLEGLMESAR